MMRTEQNSNRMRKGKPADTVKTSKEHAEWRRLPQENLNILDLLKRNKWPQYHKERSWQVCQS